MRAPRNTPKPACLQGRNVLCDVNSDRRRHAPQSLKVVKQAMWQPTSFELLSHRYTKLGPDLNPRLYKDC